MSKDKDMDKDIIFTGTLILDGHLSPKQQREKVFQIMQQAGVLVDNPDDLEIVYDGVNDNDGLSETQTSDFTVYRKRQKDSSKEMLTLSLAAIKELRSHLETIVDFDERKKIIDELFEKTDELEKRLGNVSEVNEELVHEFDQIDMGIESLEKSLKESIDEYQQSSDRLQNILKEQEKAFNTLLLSEEEINKLREDYASKKLEENNNSVHIQHMIMEQRRLLKNLKRKKNKMEKDVEKANSLGVSVSNYEEITNTLQKKDIVNAILEQKGLDDIANKKASNRTKEEKKIIKEAKDKIIEEISKVQKEENLSVLDAIEVLYSIQVEYQMNKPSRVLLVKEKQLNDIREHIEDMPERIVGDAKVYDYVPEKVPEDLKDIESVPREEVFAGSYLLTDEKTSEEQQRNKVFDLMRMSGITVNDENDYEIVYEGVDTNNPDSTRFVVYQKVKENDDVEKSNPQLNVSIELDKGIDERIVFFRDQEHEDDVYVRDYVVKRFNIIPDSEEVRIDESLCYQIDEDAQKFILGNQHNSYSPYFVEERVVSIPKEEFKNEVIEEKALEKIIFYQDLDNNYEKYVNEDTVKRFNLIATSSKTDIDGGSYYRIENEDAEYIIGNQENHYSPYEVEFRETHLGVKNELKDTNDKEDTEIISLYRDVDNNNDVYVKKYVVDRFHFVPIGEEIRIDNNPCYQIENDAAGYLITHANNRYAPYEVEIEDIALGKKIQPDNKDVEEIEFYRDLDDNNIYVKQNVISRFHLTPIGSDKRILNGLCYPISKEDAELIIKHQDNHYSPFKVNYIDVVLDKERENEENFGTVEKMVLYQKGNQVYARKYHLNRFHLTPVGNEVRIDGILCYPISNDAFQYITKLQNNSYSPFKIEMRNMIPKKEDKEEKTVIAKVENVVLYDKDGKYYLKEAELNRFHLEPNGNAVKVDGVLCYPVDNDAVEWIKSIRDNKYSPFKIEVRRMIPRKNDKEEKTVIAKDENIVLYDRDGKYYLKEAELNRFHLKPNGDAVKVDGVLCYPVDNDAVEWIKSIQDNKYSPFKIEVRKMIPKKEQKETKTLEVVSDEIVFYHLTDKVDDIYVDNSVLLRFGIFPAGDIVRYNDRNYYCIRKVDVDKIRKIAANSKNTLIIKDKNLPIVREKKDVVAEEKEEDVTIDSVLKKLEVNPQLKKKKPNYEAKNIRVSHKFLDELGEGSWVYNIIHFLDNIRKASQALLESLSSKFLNGSLKESLQEFEDRLDSLSDKEMNVLLKEYHNIDFVDKINNLVTKRVQKYVVSKINDLETIIENGYDSLYTLMGQIYVLEENLINNKSNDTNNMYLKERKRLLDKAAFCVRDILEARGNAQDVLTPEIVASFGEFDTKFPYVGMIYQKELSPELVSLETEYRKKLKKAFQDKDRVEIVNNFMGMENCYYQDSSAALNKDSKDSVGIRYYSSMVDEFGYQDDIFSRKLFHVIAEASAKRDEVQRERNHEIQSGTLLDNTNYGTMSMDDVDESHWSLHNDSFGEDVSTEIGDILLQYSVGNNQKEEVLERIEHLVEASHNYLVAVSNDIISIVKEYAIKHSNFDVGAIEESLETIIVNPSIMGEKDLLSGSLCKLPNELLKKLVEASTLAQFSKDLSSSFKQKHETNDLVEEVSKIR